jgi:hypothetical protein
MLTRLAALVRRAPAAKSSFPLVLFTLALVSMDSAHALDISVGSKEVIYTSKQRKSKKLPNWPDGNLGVVANGGGSYDFYGANGSKPAKSTGTLTDPGQSKKSVSITNLPKKTFNYVSGGPVYHDPATDTRLMIYHAEKHGKSKKDFYSVLGLAVSTDAAGLSFRDLGTIIEPNRQTGQTEVGGGSFAVFDDQLHVYYRDWFPNGTTSEVAVARAPISDLITNALNGQGTLFNKYYNGGWTEPGRGGLSSALEIGNPPTSWLGVSYNNYLDQLVMVTSQWSNDGGDLYLSASPDGINWSPRQALALDAGEQFYPSLIGTGADPTQTGQSFYVYYTDSQKGAWSRWKDAQLVRREITINSLPTLATPEIPPAVPPMDPPLSPTGTWAAVADYQSDFQSGGPAAGWSYAWNPTGQLGNSGAFAPLLWSDVAHGYNTTGAATTVPGSTAHNDDFLMLTATGGHPGQPNYLPIAGYTIQDDDGAGLYRLANSSIAKADTILSTNEDGLEVLVYKNDALLGTAQGVTSSGLAFGFDRELGELEVGDTIWVMVSPGQNQWYDAFTRFDFTLQKSVPDAELTALALAAVPEPSTAGLILMGLVAFRLLRARRA